MDRLGIGLVGAVVLGAAAGVIVAPRSGRWVFAARVRRESDRIASYAYEQSAVAIDALPDIVDAVERGFTLAAAAITERFRTVNPTARLESAFAAHSELSRRTIWVDAHGATLLLHGLVEDDEEWRSADQLARHISPDGTVRNLLQVRHKAQSE
ncbi:MAG TPA: BON domain-containing protein [Candidatus Eremiobacteraceae bacterium]